MNDWTFDEFIANIDVEQFSDGTYMSVEKHSTVICNELIPSPPSSPLIIGTTGDDAPLSCSMSPDFVVYGEKEANEVIRQALEDPAQCGFVVNHFFPTRPFEDFSVSGGAQKVFVEPNAGGNSVNSEAISFEVLHRLYGARLVKTEMAIEYWHPNWKKTDYSVSLYDRLIGVSVTRAMKYRGVFTPEDAQTLLYKKLNGVNVSTVGVARHDRWEKQILHVWTPDEYIAITLYREYLQLPAALRSNTVVIVTVSEGAPWLYSNCMERPRVLDDLMTIG